MKKIEKERTTERKKYVALARYVSGDISDWMMTYHLFPPCLFLVTSHWMVYRKDIT